MSNNTMIGLAIALVIVVGGGYFLLSAGNSDNKANKAGGDLEEAVTGEAMVGDNEAMEEGDSMMEKDDDDEDDDIDAMDSEDDDDAMIDDAEEFDVEGTNFKFSVSEIRVEKGETVRINFTNTQGFHDWVIDEFNASTKQLKEGDSETIEFTADKVGEFEYYCSVGNHRAQGMVGKLIVVEDDDN